MSNLKILIISSHSKSLVNFRGELLKSFINLGHQVTAAGPDFNQKVKDELYDSGIEYVNYYLERAGTNVINDLKAYRSLKELIGKVNPDLVLSYTIKPVIYGSLAAKKCKVSKIHSMITGLGNAFNNYSSLLSRLLSTITRALYKISLSKTNSVIFQNPDDQKVFLDKKIINEVQAYRIFGSGVDLEEFSYAKPILNPVTFLYIGRLLKEKGINDFIEAAILIKRNYPDSEFIVVGGADNNPTSFLIKDFKKFEKSGLITFAGRVKDVRPYIEKSSVFVLPSYYGEGTPRTALESMAMGRPLIMTDSVGCRETVKEGVNGYLVPVKEPSILAEKMEKFIQDPDLILTMGNESRKFAEEVYDVHKVNQHIHQILGI